MARLENAFATFPADGVNRLLDLEMSAHDSSTCLDEVFRQ